MVVPTKLRSEPSANYKKVAPKVDCRWQAGAAATSRVVQKKKTNAKPRRKTEQDYNPQRVASLLTENESDGSVDDVFDSNSNVMSSTPFDHSSSSNESVTEHYGRLFQQLDAYTKAAPDFDGIFIRQQVARMKNEMYAINEMFKDLVFTGERLKKFLADRQNKNASKNSA